MRRVWVLCSHSELMGDLLPCVPHQDTGYMLRGAQPAEKEAQGGPSRSPQLPDRRVLGSAAMEQTPGCTGEV